MELWDLWPVLPLLGTGMLGAQSERAMDGLLCLEYTSYQEEWVKDGKPSRHRWRWSWDIDVLTSVESAWSRSLVWFVWLSDTPDWAKADSQALKLLKQMRLFTLLTFIAFIGTGIILGLYG